MSVADFSDINIICCELCEDKEEKGRKEHRETVLLTNYGTHQLSEPSLFFESQREYPVYGSGMKIND